MFHQFVQRLDGLLILQPHEDATNDRPGPLVERLDKLFCRPGVPDLPQNSFGRIPGLPVTSLQRHEQVLDTGATHPGERDRQCRRRALPPQGSERRHRPWIPELPEQLGRLLLAWAFLQDRDQRRHCSLDLELTQNLHRHLANPLVLVLQRDNERVHHTRISNLAQGHDHRQSQAFTRRVHGLDQRRHGSLIPKSPEGCGGCHAHVIVGVLQGHHERGYRARIAQPAKGLGCQEPLARLFVLQTLQ